MKNLTFYLIVILLFSSCSASWHVKRAEWKQPDIFKSKTDTIIKIEYSDLLVKLDTIINVILPRDTVKIDSLVFRTLRPSFDKIVKKNGIITANVWMVKGRLNVETYLDSAMIYLLQTKIRVKDAKIKELKIINNENTVTIEKQSTKIKTFLIWLKWIGIAVGSLVVLVIIYKIYKWIKR